MGYIDILEKQWKRHYFNDYDCDFHIKYYKKNSEIDYSKITSSETLDIDNGILSNYQNNLLPTVEIFNSERQQLFTNGINQHDRLLNSLISERNKLTELMIKTISNLKTTYREKLDLIFKFDVYSEVESYLSYPDSQNSKFHDYIDNRTRGMINYEYYLEDEDNEEILKEWYDYITKYQIKGCDYDW